MAPLEGPRTLRSKAGDTQVRGSDKFRRAVRHGIHGQECYRCSGPHLGLQGLQYRALNWPGDSRKPARGRTVQRREGARESITQRWDVTR